MRIRTLFLLTSLTSVVACGGDDEDTDPTGASDPSSESGSASLTTTSPAESSSDDTLTTTSPSTESGSESGGTGSESGSDSSAGPADSSGSESGSTGEPATPCEYYCDLFQTNCDGGVGTSDPYADDAACLTACAGFSTGGLECRTGHLDGTITMPKALNEAYYMDHCPHGDVDGTGVCAD